MVSTLAFDHFDVDHVVLARCGVLAVEVKFLTNPHRPSPEREVDPLDDVPELPGMLAQARRGAHTVGLLLRSRHVPVPVRPLLILAGPGSPDLRGTVRLLDGVAVVAWRDIDTWSARLAAASGALDELTARAAADALLAFHGERRSRDRAVSAGRSGSGVSQSSR